MKDRDEQQDRFYEQVDELEAATKDLARAEPALSLDAQATIFDSLNDIRHAGREPDPEPEPLAKKQQG
jgi:hypothetical protein